jgi:hypothetical protein
MNAEVEAVLDEPNLTLAEQSLLAATSYYLPMPQEELIVLAQLESDGQVAEEDLMHALASCQEKGWLTEDTRDRKVLVQQELRNGGVTYPKHGLVLTDLGESIKSTPSRNVTAAQAA